MNSMAQGGLPARRRRDDRLVREPRFGGPQRQRRARLRPEPDRGLTVVTRTLDSPPSSVSLYARAGLGALPLSGRLPFLAGGGGEVPDLELELADVVGRPGAARRLLQGLRVQRARDHARDLPAHPRFPPAHGAAHRLELPRPGNRHGPHPQPDHAAAADRRPGAADDPRPLDQARAPREGADVHADHRGARGRASSSGSARARTCVAAAAQAPGRRAPATRSPTSATCPPRPSGALPATWAAATPPSPATATRSTSTA